MTIVKKGQSKNNKCDIQLEDWSKNYPGLYEPGAYLAAYPKAVKTIWFADKGRNIFKAGVEFRMDLPFETAKEAEEAFTALEAGEKSLSDFIPQCTSMFGCETVLEAKEFLSRALGVTD